MNYGILYGVGTGPGDPDLLTLKAVKVLSSVDRVYAARSSKNTHSVSHGIVRPHLREGVDVQSLPFPMTRDKNILGEAWTANAQRVLDDLRQGLNVAFLTLGDPMTYSTFGYLWRTLHELDAQAPVEVVPGITSYNAAAAASGTILVEAEETLAVVSGANGGGNLRKAAEMADSVVVLKAYKHFDDIQQSLEDIGMLKSSVLVSNCGQQGERIAEDCSTNGDGPQYFSLILAKKPKNISS
ncbi:precorrin-2 C(20)-methyltransferase [Desulfovibrio ferrophilus]|uniref:Precorrin-2 C(20)-methyltransferase n=1 Tax=Desulfovibrio ferrophilus TaxID=241368 RepID=A0A2Z6AWW2_9BACT|nr:precorrin-2 C(20)-methyltransferase [Desulfovibrio ferrophilus]BBD07744.1 precorrin-2 C(20)-methyltransferase [Desulfovibrio ferrophilus]